MLLSRATSRLVAPWQRPHCDTVQGNNISVCSQRSHRNKVLLSPSLTILMLKMSPAKCVSRALIDSPTIKHRNGPTSTCGPFMGRVQGDVGCQHQAGLLQKEAASTLYLTMSQKREQSCYPQAWQWPHTRLRAWSGKLQVFLCDLARQ